MKDAKDSEQKLALGGIRKVEPKKQGSKLRSMMAESRMSKQSYVTAGSYAQRVENVPKKQRPLKVEPKPQPKLSNHVAGNSYGAAPKLPFNPFGGLPEPTLGSTQPMPAF